jgi:hypothetical protein
VAFGYYLTLPFALQFFQSVGGGALLPLITANEYFNFILGYLTTFAVVFQLPLLLLFINHITPFKPGGLSKWRKHVYIGAFAISLIMPSSPDPLSQISLAIPIIVLYEFSNFLIWRVNRNKYRHAMENQRVNEELPAAAHGFGDAQLSPVASLDHSVSDSPAAKTADDITRLLGRRLTAVQTMQNSIETDQLADPKIWHRRDAVPESSMNTSEM